MTDLVIPNATLWNTLTKQSIDPNDTTNVLFKSGKGINGGTYPYGDKYYYASFEDLYPFEGDYDFNDMVLRSKLDLEWGSNEYSGTFNTHVVKCSGGVQKYLGLMFYMESNGVYTRVPNADIMINGEPIIGDEPYIVGIPREGDDIEIDFMLNGSGNFWATYFLKTFAYGEWREIHSAGFPNSTVTEFTLPQTEYLTEENLPWGFEIETEDLAITLEKSSFLDAFPFFAIWAQSGGTEETDWFNNPDAEFTE